MTAVSVNSAAFFRYGGEMGELPLEFCARPLDNETTFIPERMQTR